MAQGGFVNAAQSVAAPSQSGSAPAPAQPTMPPDMSAYFAAPATSQSRYNPTLGPQTTNPFYQTPPTPPMGTRVSSSASQFYQPVFRPSYMGYNFPGSQYGVSAYGNPFMGGYSPYGARPQFGGFGGFGGYGGYGMPNPMLGLFSNLFQSQQTPQAAQPASDGSGIAGLLG